MYQTEHERGLLLKYGSIVGLDSTHCTNKEGVQLYTLVVTEDDGKISPAGCFLPSQNDDECVTAALFEISRLCEHKWIPRIALVDDAVTGMYAYRAYRAVPSSLQAAHLSLCAHRIECVQSCIRTIHHSSCVLLARCPQPGHARSRVHGTAINKRQTLT